MGRRQGARIWPAWSISISAKDFAALVCVHSLVCSFSFGQTDTLTAQTVTMDSQTADRQTSDKRTNIDTDSQPARQTERQRERQTSRQTERQTNRQRDRETQTDLYRGPVIVATPETSQAGEQANEEFK